MYTSQMRMTGLSGIDTESMITQLMRAESLNLARLRQKKQLLAWKQEAYVSATNSLKSFQTSTLSLSSITNIRAVSSFKGYTPTVKLKEGTTSTNSNAVSIRANSTATGGLHTLKVNSVAQKDTYVSASPIASVIEGGKALDGSSFKEGESIRISLDGGTAKEIKLDSTFFSGGSLDVANFDTNLQNAINAAFGSGKVSVAMTNNKLSLSASAGHTFSVSDGTKIGNAGTFGTANFAPTGETAIRFGVEITSDTASTQHNLSVAVEADDTPEAIIAKMNKAMQDEGITGVSASLKDGKLVFTNGNAAQSVKIGDVTDGTTVGMDLFSLVGQAATDELTLEGNSTMNILGMKSGASSALDMTKSLGAYLGTTAFESMANDTIANGGKIMISINNQMLEFSADQSLKDVMNAVNQSGAGVKLSFDTFKSSFKLEAEASGAANKIAMSQTAKDFFAAAMKIDETNAASYISEAQDAVFTLDGVTTSRDTNNFTINGMTITLNPSAVAADGTPSEFEINLEKDTTAVMDLVKKFVAEYNTLVDTLNKATKTARPKSDSYNYYEPLTDDEKKEMSDKDIERWEEQAKTGMLYRDDILQGITSQMRSVLYDSVELEDGTKISLYEIGITTSSKLSDLGKLVIDEDKLKTALEERGDAVAGLFTKSSDISASDKSQRNARLKSEGLAERLNDIINWSTSVGSALNTRAGIAGVASEKSSEMYLKMKAQEEKISDMLTYLAKRETFYYQMFSKLEAAMNESNAQMASLQSMLGLNMG